MSSLRSRFAFAAILTLLSTSAFAHVGHHHGHRHGQSHDKKSPGVLTCESTECDELRAILDDAHHAIEAGDTSSFFQRWKGKLNLKNTALAAYRWYSANRNKPHVANAVPNVSLMLVGSHFLEGATGAGMVSLGFSNPGSIEQLLYTAVGITITVPGFDPLCLVLFGSYMKWPKAMDRLLTAPRIAVMETVHMMEFMAGVPGNWFDATLQSRRIDKFLNGIKRADGMIIPVKEEGDWIFNLETDTGDTAAQLKFSPLDDGRYGLAEVMLNDDVKTDWWMRHLKLFGLNIRTLIKELQKEKSSAQPYIQFTERERFGKRYHLMADAFPFINFDTEECESALQRR